MKIKITEVYKGLKYQGEDYSYRLEVSNFGNLRNTVTKKVYKLQLNKTTGYLGTYVSLGSRSKGKFFKSHIAVACTFIPNPNNLPVVNHKDGIKTNCFVSNLEWCTHQYNTQHAFATGLNSLTHLYSHSQSVKVFSDEDSLYLQSIYIPKDPIFGARAIARELGVHSSIVKRALHREVNK
jgi:hypothetical protein